MKAKEKKDYIEALQVCLEQQSYGDPNVCHLCKSFGCRKCPCSKYTKAKGIRPIKGNPPFSHDQLPCYAIWEDYLRKEELPDDFEMEDHPLDCKVVLKKILWWVRRQPVN